MRREQFEHMLEIADQFNELMTTKYVQGAREHGGFIWDQTVTQLLNNALEEAVDQVVYLMTLHLKLALLCAKDPAILTSGNSTEFANELLERSRNRSSQTGPGR